MNSMRLMRLSLLVLLWFVTDFSLASASGGALGALTPTNDSKLYDLGHRTLVRLQPLQGSLLGATLGNSAVARIAVQVTTSPEAVEPSLVLRELKFRDQGKGIHCALSPNLKALQPLRFTLTLRQSTSEGRAKPLHYWYQGTSGSWVALRPLPLSIQKGDSREDLVALVIPSPDENFSIFISSDAERLPPNSAFEYLEGGLIPGALPIVLALCMLATVAPLSAYLHRKEGGA